MNSELKLRQQLVMHLQGGMAFRTIDSLIYDVPFEKTGIRVEGLPYSIWEVMYHLRFAQEDILDFCINSDYKHRKWPEDYWPEKSEPDSPEMWKEMVDLYFSERAQFKNLILDQQNDLFAPLPHAPDISILREVLLVIEHNAHHIGQLVVLMRLLGVLENDNQE